MKTLARANGSRRDAALVASACEGDKESFGRLYDAHVDRVFAVLMGIVRDEATAADLTQDTFVAAWRQLPSLETPASFRYWLVRIARNKALDHVKVAERTKAIDNMAITELEEAANATGSRMLVGLDVTDRACRYDDPEQASEDAEVCELVWTAAEALGPNDMILLDLHLRHNMSPAQIAAIVDASNNTVRQALYRLRAKLASSVQAAVLWRGGRPRCRALQSALDTASIAGFSWEAVGVIGRHVETCPACEERQRTLLSPAVLFEVIPLAAAPPELRDRIADAIAGSDAASCPAVAGAPSSAGRFGSGRIGRSALRELATHPLPESVANTMTNVIKATAAVLVAATLIVGTAAGPTSRLATAAEPQSIERDDTASPVNTPGTQWKPSRAEASSGETPRPGELLQNDSDQWPTMHPRRRERDAERRRRRAAHRREEREKDKKVKNDPGHEKPGEAKEPPPQAKEPPAPAKEPPAPAKEPPAQTKEDSEPG